MSLLSEEAQALTWQVGAGCGWEASVPPDMGRPRGLLEHPYAVASVPPRNDNWVQSQAA